MTPEQELRQAILDAAPAAGGKRDKRAAKRAQRAKRANRSANRRWVFRLIFMALSLSGSAMMVFTESGREMRREFQAGLLDVIRTEMEARREAQVAYADPSADPDTLATHAVTAAAQGAKLTPPSQATPIRVPDKITFVPARGSERVERPIVSDMPQSRVTIRRIGD
ncbi:hypothetical protein J4E08_20825 [Sagittula sp. NFXS13]|uniref:hypothetical protein n=1 Tax=Sagittula sp. NFXS13 TaxID=2819095 RepID=UPI0032DFB40F